MLVKDHPLTGVRTRRQILGVTAADMAQRLGCTPTTYSRYERGERRVFLDQAKTIATFLGCSIDELSREPTVDEQVELFKRAKIRQSGIEQGISPDDAEVEAELLSQWPGGDDE